MLGELFVSLCLLVMLFAPLALAVNFALRRYTRMATFWLVLIPLVSTLVLTPLLLWVGFWIVTYYPKHEFDAKGWREKPHERYEYAEDLVKHKRLVGQTREEVFSQLGPPRWPKGDTLWWEAGSPPGFLLNCRQEFVVYFQNGQCIRAETYCGD